VIERHGRRRLRVRGSDQAAAGSVARRTVVHPADQVTAGLAHVRPVVHVTDPAASGAVLSAWSEAPAGRLVRVADQDQDGAIR